ncbi:MAG: GNAT family N-acetyltransferase [Natronospirillum sp.]|uniref:GNAT family N-acetyltransferase n=1 Tax=Natronospirillum sp. TaxID=2812955 RepID=UPI0025D1FA26|nr:GNAT family N-acetyltransferase [Natronospirillum sp.]MCH8552026.1 GNAT family N-acetyltransferase [Natronospirillum sp.]
MSHPPSLHPVNDLAALPSRQLWLLDGTDEPLSDALQALAGQARQADWQTLYVPGPGVETATLSHWPDAVPGRQLMRRLGHSVDRLVLDWRFGWHLNHLSQAAGCVRAGGQLIILLNANAPERYGWLRNQPSRWFATWRDTLLERGAQWLEDVAALPAPEPAALAVAPEGTLLPATPDQATAVTALTDLADAPRGSGCLVSAPRGHGKTVALALAVRSLLARGHTITVLAAQGEPLSQVQHWLQRAGCSEMAEAGTLRTLTWDQWQTDGATADLVLADEAAMLGVPRLQALVERADRLACITTTEGYEGSGQGFLLRFLPGWKASAPVWQHLTLSTPIRWTAGDALTEALQAALLYPQQSSDGWLQNNAAGSAEWTPPQRLEAIELLSDQALRDDWIHLLTAAHYQTRPDDLRQCLDSSDVLALGVKAGGRLVGLLLALSEPPLPDDLAQAVWQGTRRPGSQLAKQSLVGQLGCRSAADWRGWRIWRLVVHPGWQRRGIASALLKALQAETVEEQAPDYLAASFGLTADLCTFWHTNGFWPVRLGQQAEAASGERALLVVRPGEPSVAQVCRQASSSLGAQTLLHVEQTATLSVPTLLALARAVPPPPISDHDKARLQHWCASHQPESALRPVIALALWHRVAQDGAEAEPLLPAWVRRVWQNQAWSLIQQQLRLADRQACVQALRTALQSGSSF